MEYISFLTNWNNKLQCQVFSTIRLHNPRKYKKGECYNVFLNGLQYPSVECMNVITVTTDKLSDYVCLLDTGYDKKETLAILGKMYPGINMNTQLFDVILLKKIKQDAPKQAEMELFENSKI